MWKVSLKFSWFPLIVKGWCNSSNNLDLTRQHPEKEARRWGGWRGKKSAFFAWMVSQQEGQTFPVVLTVY